MSNLSRNELSNWGLALALLVLGGFYAHSSWRLWQEDSLVGPVAFGLLLGYTIVLVVVLVAYQVLLAVLTRPQPVDERDRQIDWRAGHIGGLVMAFGVISVVGQIFLDGWLGLDRLPSPLAIAHALLLVVFAATFVELALKLYYYRRGF